MFNFTGLSLKDKYTTMIKITRALIAIISLIFLFERASFSQKSQIYSYSERDFYKGLELYEKEKYGAARKFFDRIAEKEKIEKSELKSEAQYYQAMCAIELFNLDAEYLVFKFANENPQSPFINDAYFRLADYMYKKKNYPRTIMYYESVNRYLLDNEQLSQYYFQKGYSHYMRRQMEEARVNFYEIKDIDSKYSSPALYYYSHIAYDQGNYETAVQGFLRLLDDDTFSQVAPYYVAQIYYLQKKFEEVIEFAPPLMETITPRRSAEMSKIIGESYFYLERYDEAIPYLQKYKDEVRSVSIQDKYQLAFSYYKIGDYEEAAKLFERITMTETEISMSALYNLADCYLQMGDKNKARTAFGSCSRMEFNPEIQEDALFNYAKLTYELSYSPFNEAVRTLNFYIRQYPASPRVDEAYNILVMAYLNTKNYRLAMESLEKIRYKTPEIERAYQKVAFFLGLELFTNQRFNDAISAFDRSIKYDTYDDVIRARTLYWLAECYMRENDHETAEDYYNMFLEEPVAFQTPEYKKVNYSMGYLEFSRKNYGKAEKWFTEYVNLEKDRSAVTLADAYNRLGDCRFINSKYWQAIDYYDKVITAGKADVDYAYFQKGFSLGLVDRVDRKIETMKELLEKYPGSAYMDDALFELGKSYVLKDNPSAAKVNYLKIVEQNPNSNYISKSLIQLGLIERNADNNVEALKYYKRVVQDYPGTPESSNALKSIRDIYVDMNNVNGYLAYVEEMGEGVSVSEQDSLIYIAAENAYLQGNCDRAIPNLRDYIQRFSKGAFLLNAHYYLSDCLLKSGKGQEAMESLLYIIGQPSSIFTEPALLAACRISFDGKDYNRSAELYKKLIGLGENKANVAEAELGLMRSYARLGEYKNTIDAARIVLLQDKLEEPVKKEANYLIAKAYMNQNDLVSAYDWFDKIDGEVNTEFGAEAKYTMAEIDFNRGRIDNADKLVFEMINMNTPHHYWMGKTFLLLSDIYMARKDEFQAVQTLESVINYYPNEDDGIKTDALARKDSITEKVNLENQAAEPDTLEIQMDQE